MTDTTEADDDRHCRRPTRRPRSSGDLRALARGGRLRARRRRLDAPTRPLPPFTIIQPPPNVTGSLHLGHAQRTAVEDLMIRHARMRGHPTLFLPGPRPRLDRRPVRPRPDPRHGRGEPRHARPRALPRADVGVHRRRPARSCSASSAGSAASCDWGRLRFTMDEGSAKAVRVAFERLYRDGLAYRTEALINWCPGCRTSVSDLEVIPTPETGTLWTVRYHLIDEATGEPDPDATITRRDDAARDDPRRHRGRGPPRRRALRGARRAAGPDPVRRARRADHRRRRRRPGASGPAR